MTKFNKPNITDWIQSISEAIAIPAAIIAFIAFFQKDKELQRQINYLDTISRQSIIHTKILETQVDYLKDEKDFQIRQNDSSISHRKSEIEPKLTIEFESNDNNNNITALLINSGKSARIIDIKENKVNGYKIDIPRS